MVTGWPTQSAHPGLNSHPSPATIETAEIRRASQEIYDVDKHLALRRTPISGIITSVDLRRSRGGYGTAIVVLPHPLHSRILAKAASAWPGLHHFPPPTCASGCTEPGGTRRKRLEAHPVAVLIRSWRREELGGRCAGLADSRRASVCLAMWAAPVFDLGHGVEQLGFRCRWRQRVRRAPGPGCGRSRGARYFVMRNFCVRAPRSRCHYSCKFRALHGVVAADKFHWNVCKQ